MRPLLLVALVVCGCTITPGKVEKQPPGGYYALGVKPKELPWQNWMNQEIHHWLGVYHKELGHLGYIGCFSEYYHDKTKRLDWYVVLNRDFEPIGCITERGRTYRFIGNPEFEEVRYIGTYTLNEALEHLYNVAKVSGPDMWYLHAVQPTAELPLFTPIRYTGLTCMPRKKRARGK